MFFSEIRAPTNNYFFIDIDNLLIIFLINDRIDKGSLNMGFYKIKAGET